MRLLLALALLAAGCASSPPAIDVPDDLVVDVSQGGGFTGAWSGLTLTADGAVTSWTTDGGTRSTQPAGALDAQAVASLWQRVQADALTASADALGNLSRAIEVTADADTHRLTWEPGARPGLDRLFTDLMAALEAASP